MPTVVVNVSKLIQVYVIAWLLAHLPFLSNLCGSFFVRPPAFRPLHYPWQQFIATETVVNNSSIIVNSTKWTESLRDTGWRISTIGTTILPDMISLAASGRLQIPWLNTAKKCVKESAKSREIRSLFNKYYQILHVLPCRPSQQPYWQWRHQNVRSVFSKLEKTAENVACDSFGSNFNGVACPNNWWVSC